MISTDRFDSDQFPAHHAARFGRTLLRTCLFSVQVVFEPVGRHFGRNGQKRRVLVDRSYGRGVYSLVLCPYSVRTLSRVPVLSAVCPFRRQSVFGVCTALVSLPDAVRLRGARILDSGRPAELNRPTRAYPEGVPTTQAGVRAAYPRRPVAFRGFYPAGVSQLYPVQPLDRRERCTTPLRSTAVIDDKHQGQASPTPGFVVEHC